MAELQHPDLHWFFPRPRLKDADPDAATVRRDYAEEIARRVAAGGLYKAPDGSEAVYVAAVRALVQVAVMSPAVSRRKVIIVGDSERMVAQEGADQAANAFLKLLEEPPADTIVIVTSSEPGALLPTIRSRVVSIRVAPLTDAEVATFLDDPVVDRWIVADAGKRPAPGRAELMALAAGAPGRALQGPGTANAAARRMLDAATGRGRAALYREAFIQKSASARGDFAPVLHALTAAIHERVKRHAARGENDAAYRATFAVPAIERAKERANGNVSPQLITATLLRELRDCLQ